MQEQTTAEHVKRGQVELWPGGSLIALLALVGSKSIGVEELRRKTRLNAFAFRGLLEALQSEYLIEVVSHMEGTHVGERVELTRRGKEVLVKMLETTCELPDLQDLI